MKRLWEKDAEDLQKYYDELPYERRIKTMKPKGYRKPDMEKVKPQVRPGRKKRKHT